MSAFRTFKIDWRKKALAFQLFDRMPLGERVYYEVQKRVTKTVPRVLSPTAETARWFIEHQRVAREHVDLDPATFFEFGAGWDLYSNLVLWCYGVNHQIVYDLREWAKPDQINIVVAHLQHEPPPGCVRLPTHKIGEGRNFRAELRAVYGITYMAPADAGNTGLRNGSVDVVVTTSVLEHVPEDQLRRILTECRRLMSERSLMSHVIDYSDHYAHSDPAITRYNFLQFSDREWSRFNPGIHFQNRLRHPDYVKLFTELGFTIEHQMVEMAEDAVMEFQRMPRFDTRFGKMAPSDLLPTLGHFILRK